MLTRGGSDGKLGVPSVKENSPESEANGDVRNRGFLRSELASDVNMRNNSDVFYLIHRADYILKFTVCQKKSSGKKDGKRTYRGFELECREGGICVLFDAKELI